MVKNINIFWAKIYIYIYFFYKITYKQTDANPTQSAKCAEWLSHKGWCTICEFSHVLPGFKGFAEDFDAHES